MPVAVYRPTPKQVIIKREEPDALDNVIDKVSKALNIASSVYGIKDGMQKAELLKQQGEMAQTRFEMEGKNRGEDMAFRQQQSDIDLASKGLIKDPSGKIMEDPSSSIIKSRLMGRQGDPQAQMLRDLSIKEKQASAAKRSDPNRYENLPQDKKIMVSDLSKSKVKQMTINNMVGSLSDQLDDPNISDEQKVASSLEQLKLMNSALGADALGTGETERVSKFLTNSPSPSVGKYGFGPDINGFKEQIKNALKRNNSSLEAVQGQIDESYGRKPQQKDNREGLGVLPSGRKVLSPEDAQKMLIQKMGIASSVKDKK